MVLVQRVFNYSILLLLILSCKTLEDTNEPIKKTITILENKNNTIIENDYLKENIIKNQEVITNGSISTISRFGSDLWIGKLGGSLLRYNLYTGDIKVFTKDIYSIKDYSIKKIVETADSIFALQTDRVITINKSNQEVNISNFPSEINRASDMVIYNNKAYISTLGYGIREYIPEENSFKEFINNLDFVSSLYLDNNILYIGSMNNGLYEYDLKQKKLLSRFNYPMVVFNKNILQINKSNNILWIGSSKNGLIKWDLNNNNIEHLYEKESVSSIYIDDYDNTYAVSFIGLGILIEKNNLSTFESINTQLITNNITVVSIFNNTIISGNIKKGLIKQEISFLND